jgi:IPT/TIG domain
MSFWQWVRENVWRYVLFAVVLIGLWRLMSGIVGNFSLSFPLPTLALSGVLVLLASLLVFAMLLNTVGLSDKTQALGLPEGSVRAMLALALLGLFAILAASVLAKPEERKYSGLSADDVAALVKNNPDARDIVQMQEKDSQPTTYTVVFHSPARQDDFAKQMLTLVGTLMTSVISFYFGTASLTSSLRAVSDGSRAGPTLSAVQPAVTPPTDGPLDLTLTGSNLNNIKTVRLTQGAVELEAHTVLSNAAQVTCTFSAHPALNTEGTWDVTVADDIGRTATKKGGLEVKIGSAADSSGSAKPTGITPRTATKDTPATFTIAGTGLAGVTGVAAVPATGGNPVSGTIVSKDDTKIDCQFALPAGDWTVQVTAGSTPPVSVPGQIQVA